MSDNIVIGGPPNYARAGLCIVEGTASFALPSSMLLDPAPSNPAQISSLDPSKYFRLVMSPTPAILSTNAGLVGIADIGVQRPSIARYRQWGAPIAKIRMCVSTAGAVAHPDYERPPATLVSVTGFTGSVADIDESPYSPDANVLGWSGSGSFPDAVTIGFSWAGAAPYPGEHMQVFAVRVEGVGSGVLPTAVTMAVYESGSPVAAAPSRTVYVLPGEEAVVLLTWNAAHLADSSGASAQLRIVTDSSATRGVNLHAVRWYGQRGNTTLAPDFDTGWVDLLEQDTVYLGDEGVGDIADPTVTRAWVVPEAVRAAGWRYASFGFLVESGPVADPFTPASLDLGCALVMPIMQPAVNFDASGQLRVEDESTSGTTLGGQWFGAIRRPRRSAEMTLPGLSLAEAAALYRRLDFGSGTARPFFISCWPAVDDPRHVLGQFYCRLRDTDGMGLRAAPSKMQRRLSVVEYV